MTVTKHIFILLQSKQTQLQAVRTITSTSTNAPKRLLTETGVDKL